MSNNESASKEHSAQSVLGRLGSAIPTLSWVFYCIAVIAPALTIDSIPFAGMPGIFAAGGRYPLRIAALGLPLAVSGVLWAVTLHRERRVRYSPFLVGILGLLVLAVASTVAAVDRRVALFGFWIDEQGMIVWLMYFMLVILGSQLINSKRRLLQSAWCLVGTGAVVAAIAVAEVGGARFFGIVAQDWVYQRGNSTMMNPDFLGTFLVAPLILAIALIAGSKGVARWFAVLSAAVMIISLGYTLTRGAWVGAFAGLAVFAISFFVAGRRSVSAGVGGEASESRMGGSARSALTWTGLVALVAMAFVVMGGSSITDRVTRSVGQLTNLDSLLSSRLSIWGEMIPTIWARPWLGAGPDNIVYAWQTHATQATVRAIGPNEVMNSSHNVALDLAVQFGAPFALLVIAGSAWLATRVVVRSLDAWGGGQHSLLQLGFVSSLAGLSVAFIAGVTTVPIIVVACALLAALIAIDASRYASPKGAWAIALAVGAISLGLGWFAYTAGASAIAGNQYAPNSLVRAQRDLAALRLAPWRIYPASDLVGVVQTMSSAEQGMISVDTGRAMELLEERDGANAITLYQIGDYYLMQQGGPERALVYAERALAARPVSVAGMMLKGDALAATGRLDEALPLLRDAVELESQAREIVAWEPPWASYASALVTQAESDPVAVRQASELLVRYERRFPGSSAAQQFREQLAGLADQTTQP